MKPPRRSTARKSVTPKKQLFVREYLKDFNVRQAVIRAGYSAHSAGHIGQRLMKDPFIKEQIDRVLAQITQAQEVEVGQIVAELKKIGFMVPLDFMHIRRSGRVSFDMNRLTESQAAAIKSIKVTKEGKLEFEFHDKIAALVHLGRYKKMFTDKIEFEGGDLAARLAKARRRRKGDQEDDQEE